MCMSESLSVWRHLVFCLEKGRPHPLPHLSQSPWKNCGQKHYFRMRNEVARLTQAAPVQKAMRGMCSVSGQEQHFKCDVTSHKRKHSTRQRKKPRCMRASCTVKHYHWILISGIALFVKPEWVYLLHSILTCSSRSAGREKVWKEEFNKN